MREESPRRSVRILVLLVAAAFALPAHGDEQVDRLIAYILDALETPQVACGEPVHAEYGARRVVCGRYREAFSGLKSDWEQVMRHTDLPLPLKTEDAWTLLRGVYRIVYTFDEERELHVAFEEGSRDLRFAYLETDPEPHGGSARVARDGPLRSYGDAPPPRMAGFGGVSMPRLIEETRVEPLRSFRAQAERVMGIVTLEIVVRDDGTVREVVALDDEPAGYGFGEAAVEAVRQWRFEPAMLEGRPVEAVMNLKLEVREDPPPQGGAGDDAGQG